MQTLLCKICRQTKVIGKFDKDRTKRRGYSVWCKDCKKNNSALRIKMGKNRARQCKLDKGACEICLLVVNHDNLFLFEWDHINPKNKLYTIGKMQLFSDKKFYTELKKCRLLCRDCHRLHTSEQHAIGLFNKNFDNLELNLDFSQQLQLFEVVHGI